MNYGHDNGEDYEHLIFGWGRNPVEDGEMTEEEYQNEIDNYYADCHCKCIELSKEEYNNETGEGD